MVIASVLESGETWNLEGDEVDGSVRDNWVRVWIV